MTKYGKELILSIAPYKTIKIMVSDCNSFEEVDKEIRKELDRHPEVKKLNAEEIEKVLS